MLPELILSAGRLLQRRGVWLKPGALYLRDGLIEDVGDPGELACRHPGVERIELFGSALVPGLVNAHAHLELGALEGALPHGQDFSAWVRALVQLRGQKTHSELGSAALAGAQRCLAGGATTVGDFDASGAAERAFAQAPVGGLPRIVLFRELLDARSLERTGPALQRLSAPRMMHARLRPALAPHAPHTVSESLLAAMVFAAHAEGLALSTHWSVS